MMSLTNITLGDVVKKQFQFKLHAYSGVYLSLVVLQLIGVLFSLGGVGSSGGGTNTINYNMNYYSGDIVIFFTILWGFIVSILVTTSAYRNDDFTFISNRLSSDLSNYLFLILASLIGAFTALLSSFLLKTLVFILPGFEVLHYYSSEISPTEYILGFVTTFLYIILLAALGYLIGNLVRLNPLLKILIPVVFFGYLFVGGMFAEVSGLTAVIEFFISETDPVLFILKSAATAALLLAVSAWINSRVEVRR
jgi:hypothetical protein